MSLREPLFARTGSASDSDTACDKYKASPRGRVITMETKLTNVVIENIMNSNRTFTESISYSCSDTDVLLKAPCSPIMSPDGHMERRGELVETKEFYLGINEIVQHATTLVV